jgi:fatty acid desaturase
LAVTGWLLGAVGHDGGHFAVSRHPVANDWAVWGMSLLCNPIMWQHQHTYAHHSHTNDFDKDPDLHHYVTFLRVHERFQHHSVYRYQIHFLFVMLAYAFTVFGECFWVPWGMLTEGSLYGMVDWTDRRRREACFVLHWAAYAGFIFVLPFAVHLSWWKAAVAATLHTATSGLLFAFFSQINHLNELSLATDRPDARIGNSALQHSWAVEQVETSNNFCPNSALWHVLSNGLNLQIEHHLFPGLNHCHLPLIQPTVEAVCEEYGVSYKCYETWKDLTKETQRWLKRLSREVED